MTRAEIRALFVPPFRAVGFDEPSATIGNDPVFTGLYVLDTKENMAADRNGARGWGRIQYMPDGERLHDLWCAEYVRIVGGERDCSKVAELLNAAWKETERADA